MFALSFVRSTIHKQLDFVFCLVTTNKGPNTHTSMQEKGPLSLYIVYYNDD